MQKPNFSFKNIEGKTIFCWSTPKSFIFSLNRIDESTGKYKEILKESEEELYYTSKKLGLTDSQYKTLFNKRIEEKQEKRTNLMYNEVPDFEVKKRMLQEAIERRVGGNKTKPLSTNIPMNQLAYIAGAEDKITLTEQKQAPAQQVQREEIEYGNVESFFDKSVKIDKKPIEDTEDYTFREPVLAESKNPKIVLGKTELKALDNGLYEIKITNLPGEGVFHAKLYQSIMKYLSDNLATLKDSNPDVAAYELKTEKEMSGEKIEEEIPQGEEIDMGLSGGEETQPTGKAPAPAANSDADIMAQATDTPSLAAPAKL